MMCSVTNRFYANASLHDDVIIRVSCSFATDGFRLGKNTHFKKVFQGLFHFPIVSLGD